MYTIFDIANWFLSQDNMTPKKLQKLCYYAQAWNLALRNEKLIDGTFEAWVHGPVNPELYQQYKSYGWNEISKIETQTSIEDSNAREILESVWMTYGGYDGNQLEHLTHTEIPWIEARKGIPIFDNSNNVISEETMKDFYKSIYIGG